MSNGSQSSYEAYRNVRSKLWEIAGKTSNVERVDNADFLQKVLERGRLWNSTDMILVPGEKELYCHYNSAKRYIDEYNKYSIVTGYAYAETMRIGGHSIYEWNEHSWLYNRKTGKIEETTSGRELYYGYILEKDEVMDFLTTT